MARDGDTIRLDKWLWQARFCKTRSGAQRLCEAGAVALNGVLVGKAARKLQPGDQLRLQLGPWRLEAEVLALGTRRGPAAEARLLYRELLRERQGEPSQEEGLFDLDALAADGYPPVA